MSDDQPASSPSEPDQKTKSLEKCPIKGCGRAFKDLKTHLLTHGNERPEKCPMRNCEYSKKGFARRYDRNRHVLTHFKGILTCGFCPADEDSSKTTFHRPDSFKRHLATIHGADTSAVAESDEVEDESPAVFVRCSICGGMLSSPPELFEHLDDCVLKSLQRSDESEAINEMRLAEVEDDDDDFLATLRRNNLSTKTTSLELEEHYVSSDEQAERDPSNLVVTRSSKKKKGISQGIQKSESSGRSQGSSNVKFRRRKASAKSYPPAWGFHSSVMTMRHRVLTVFDGSRRLVKDDMMLSNTSEVRLKLSDERYYTTDLDVQTLRRAEAFHNATEEEKGICIARSHGEVTEEGVGDLTREND